MIEGMKHGVTTYVRVYFNLHLNDKKIKKIIYIYRHIPQTIHTITINDVLRSINHYIV